MNKSLIFPVFFFAALLIGNLAPAQTAVPLDEARAALKAGDLPRAETLLAPLTVEGATNAAAFETLGQLRERQKNAKDAVTAYEQATKLDPAKSDYFAELGVALSVRIGEIPFMQRGVIANKMKKAFEKAVELDPRSLTALIGLTRFYANAPEIVGGSREKAEKYARQICVLDDYLGTVELGRIAFQNEDWPAALAPCEKAAALKPDNAALAERLGRVYAQLGRKDEARVTLRKALALDPKRDSAQKALTELDAPSADPVAPIKG